MADTAAKVTPAGGFPGRVLDQVRPDSPRTAELLTSLIRHLHEFVGRDQAHPGRVAVRARFPGPGQPVLHR